MITRRSRALSATAAATSEVLLLAARLLRGENNDDHRLNGERRLLHGLPGALRDDAVVFDVGANVGRWSVEAARQLPRAAIHAFEPLPDAFAQLAQRTNGTNVTCHPFALSSEAGTRELHYDPALSVMSSLHERDLKAFNMDLGATVEVTMDTLDAFCDREGVDRVDFVKIDVEGHERDVLVGAARHLGAGRIGLVQFEYGGTYLDAGVRLRDVTDLFPDDYTVYRLVPWGFMPLRSSDFRQESFALSNYVAVHRDLEPLLQG
jgi:FkbM family methyltransferase